MNFPYKFWHEHQALLEHRFGDKKGFTKFLEDEGYQQGMGVMIFIMHNGGQTVLVLPLELMRVLSPKGMNRKSSRGYYKFRSMRVDHIKEWEACIGIDGKVVYLGTFFTEEEAKAAYMNALRNRIMPMMSQYSDSISERSKKIINSYLQID